jgi:hypothetical protein
MIITLDIPHLIYFIVTPGGRPSEPGSQNGQRGRGTRAKILIFPRFFRRLVTEGVTPGASTGEVVG